MKRSHPTFQSDLAKRFKGHDLQFQQQPTPSSSSRQNSGLECDFAKDVWQPGFNFFQPQTTSMTTQIFSPSGFNAWHLDDDEVISPETYFALEEKFVKKFSDFRKNANSRSDQFSMDIWSYFLRNQQPGNMFRQKIELWCELNRVLCHELSCSSHAFGSTLNGFGSCESDLDLCLFFKTENTSNKQKQNSDVMTLSRTRNILRRKSASYLSGNMELIPAKVPILKVYDHFGKLEVDISCNNPLSINNTFLLFCYSQLDWRVRPLVITIKGWAKAAGINDAKDQTLSSYTLTLMVIHYLQAGVNPPVLPALQQLHPDFFGVLPVHRINFLRSIPQYQSDNNESLGNLLAGFFSYFDKDFDFTRDVGSVRTGKVLTINECHEYARDNQLGPRQWEAYICLEEPFERTNAGRAIINRQKFDEILNAFRKANKVLRKGDKCFKKLFEVQS